jgi:hypothetical protein
MFYITLRKYLLSVDMNLGCKLEERSDECDRELTLLHKINLLRSVSKIALEAGGRGRAAGSATTSVNTLIEAGIVK